MGIARLFMHIVDYSVIYIYVTNLLIFIVYYCYLFYFFLSLFSYAYFIFYCAVIL